ncbi:MAG: hypothetical protein V7776_09390 [Halopseudomonas aestusnigri]
MTTEIVGSNALLFALDAVSAMGAGTSIREVDLSGLEDSITKSQKLRRCGTEYLPEDNTEDLDEDENLELA